jgi:hypothetical protein
MAHVTLILIYDNSITNVVWFRLLRNYNFKMIVFMVIVCIKFN